MAVSAEDQVVDITEDREVASVEDPEGMAVIVPITIITTITDLSSLVIADRITDPDMAEDALAVRWVVYSFLSF